MTLSESLFELATYTRLPSRLAATPRGRLPTAMVFTTVPVLAWITVTSSDFSLVTNTRSSPEASEATAPSASTVSAARIVLRIDARSLLSGQQPQPARMLRPGQQPSIDAPHTAGAGGQQQHHRRDEQHVKPLLPEGHPLRGEAIVQRQEQSDGSRQAGEQTENEAEPDRHFPVRLQRGEQGGVGRHGAVQEVLVPADRIARRELRDPLGMEAHEAGGDHR